MLLVITATCRNQLITRDFFGIIEKIMTCNQIRKMDRQTDRETDREIERRGGGERDREINYYIKYCDIPN